MRKERILLILGIWAAVLPYLGFPTSWKNVLFSLTGLGLIYLAYVLYNQFKSAETPSEAKERTFENFSENRHFSEEVKTETS